MNGLVVSPQLVHTTEVLMGASLELAFELAAQQNRADFDILFVGLGLGCDSFLYVGSLRGVRCVNWGFEGSYVNMWMRCWKVIVVDSKVAMAVSAHTGREGVRIPRHV
jgi:hypothetical protein